ncbi:MAG: hypothetical protein ACPKPY_00465 [Nitrososphaeraceae archaeon]
MQIILTKYAKGRIIRDVFWTLEQYFEASIMEASDDVVLMSALWSVERR